jgi:hypothetical protein
MLNYKLKKYIEMLLSITVEKSIIALKAAKYKAIPALAVIKTIIFRHFCMNSTRRLA